jgi:hypothetical protein
LRSDEQAYISDGFQRWEFFLVFFELAALLLTAFVVLRNPSVSGGHVRSSCLTLLGVITAISMTEVNAKNAEMCARAAPAAFARAGERACSFAFHVFKPPYRPLPPPAQRYAAYVLQQRRALLRISRHDEPSAQRARLLRRHPDLVRRARALPSAASDAADATMLLLLVVPSPGPRATC